MRGHHHSNIAQGRGEQSAALGAERDCLPGSSHPPMAGQAEHTDGVFPPYPSAARDPRSVWIARHPLARIGSLLVEPLQESALRAVPVEVRPGQITRRVVRAVDSLLFVVDSPQQIIERVAKRLVRWRQSQTPLFQT